MTKTCTFCCLALVMTLAIPLAPLPAMAEYRGVMVEVINDTKEPISVQITINSFPNPEFLPKRSVAPGEKALFKRTETKPEATGEDLTLMGWVLKVDGGCKSTITYTRDGCRVGGGNCPENSLTNLGASSFRWRITE